MTTEGVGEEFDILAVVAHPDDEIFVSGTLCLLSEKGFTTCVVCVTDGEGGCNELLQRQSAADLAGVRRCEMLLSSWALGALEVLFLGYADDPSPKGLGSTEWDQDTLLVALKRIVREKNPKLILTHGPEGGHGHPAHKALHRYVLQAADQSLFQGSIFSFSGKVQGSFFSWFFEGSADVLIDARCFLRRRAASLSYHQSQIDFFLQPYFPRTIRKGLSALFGYIFCFTAAGRKRIPIGIPRRFFSKYPVEGLGLQRGPKDGQHFFLKHLSDDYRVGIVR